ncbi:hypothetical protein [Streptosporangium sp. G12]
MAKNEPGWHSEPPDEPADGLEKSVDLDAIERLLNELPPVMTLTSTKAELLAALPDLVRELRRAREDRSRRKALPVECRFGVAVGGDQTPDACNLFVDYTSAEAAREAAHGNRATAYMRTLTLSPWERLDDSPF